MTGSTVTVRTRRGLDAKVRVAGPPDAAPLLYLHGAGGLLDSEPLLDVLARSFRVHAPEWPGFGEEETEGSLEDMGDFTLHGWDLIDALGLERPHLVGHSMGGMIAAEMAALNPAGLDRLVLVAPFGLWLDERPIPDLFAMLPFELAEALFHDPAAGEKLLTAGLDFRDDTALKRFLVGNARRLGTAGKILFPIPNRRLSKRLYRITSPALLLWGDSDRLIDPCYGERFVELLVSTGARLERLAEAGHMVPYEQPQRAGELIGAFLGG